MLSCITNGCSEGFSVLMMNNKFESSYMLWSAVREENGMNNVR